MGLVGEGLNVSFGEWHAKTGVCARWSAEWRKNGPSSKNAHEVGAWARRWLRGSCNGATVSVSESRKPVQERVKKSTKTPRAQQLPLPSSSLDVGNNSLDIGNNSPEWKRVESLWLALALLRLAGLARSGTKTDPSAGRGSSTQGI